MHVNALHKTYCQDGCRCGARTRRNPLGLSFTIDYFHMLDALQQVVNSGVYDADYDKLHQELEQAGPRITRTQFSQIFSDSVTPPGVEPSTTEIYRDIESARGSTMAEAAELLAFVDKLRTIIGVFDRSFARNQRVLTPIVTSIQRFVENMLTRVHNEQPTLSNQSIGAISNMERFRTELNILNPAHLTLNELNNFIQRLQPTQPFGLSVMLIYQGLDPTDPGAAQSKTMEFMELLKEMSDAINPFSQELAANEEITGWRYLHVKP